MGRVINPDNVGKDRARLCKMVGLALRELVKKQEVDNETRDLSAYIALTLDRIWDTVDQSVVAWEKLGYWVKADRFRYDWSWTQRYSNLLKNALVDENWTKVAQIAVEISSKLSRVKLPSRSLSDKPWVGAWQILIRSLHQQ